MKSSLPDTLLDGDPPCTPAAHVSRRRERWRRPLGLQRPKVNSAKLGADVGPRRELGRGWPRRPAGRGRERRRPAGIGRGGGCGAATDPGAAVRAAPPLPSPAPGRPGRGAARAEQGRGDLCSVPGDSGRGAGCWHRPPPPARTPPSAPPTGTGSAAAAASGRPRLGPRFRSDPPASWFRLGTAAGREAGAAGRAEGSRGERGAGTVRRRRRQRAHREERGARAHFGGRSRGRGAGKAASAGPGMRTPVVMTLGMVLAPCGLLLNLTATLAPGWRLVKGFLNQPVDLEVYQGLWDICREQTSRERQCGQPDVWGYFEAQLVLVARGLMVTSLATTVLGLLLASLGVRCWQERPRFALAGLSGVVLFVAGLLSLVPVSWYNHFLEDRTVLPADASPVTVHVSYCLVLGYLGSCLLLLGGLSLALSFAPWCEERCRGCRKAPPGGARRSSISTVHVDWPEPALAPAIKYYSDGQHLPRPAEPRAAGKPRVGFPMPRPNAYSNPVDVLGGERADTPEASSPSTRHSQSTLPCDSDL